MADELGYSPTFESVDDVAPTITFDRTRNQSPFTRGNLYNTARVYNINENYWGSHSADYIPTTISVEDVAPKLEIRI